MFPELVTSMIRKLLSLSQRVSLVLSTEHVPRCTHFEGEIFTEIFCRCIQSNMRQPIDNFLAGQHLSSHSDLLLSGCIGLIHSNETQNQDGSRDKLGGASLVKERCFPLFDECFLTSARKKKKAKNLN